MSTDEWNKFKREVGFGKQICVEQKLRSFEQLRQAIADAVTCSNKNCSNSPTGENCPTTKGDCSPAVDRSFEELISSLATADNCSTFADNCSTLADNCSTLADNCSRPADIFSTSADNCSMSADKCSMSADNCSTLADNCSQSNDNCSKEAKNCSTIGLADLTALETSFYRQNRRCVYFSNETALLTVFTDCTERSPTFSLKPLDTVEAEEAGNTECWIKARTIKCLILED